MSKPSVTQFGPADGSANFTLTEDFNWTDAFSSTLKYTSSGSSRRPRGWPRVNLSMLEWKQSLAVISLVFVAAVIIAALLQMAFSKGCVSQFRKTQFKTTSAKVLFALFAIALVMTFVNNAVFVHFVFHITELTASAYRDQYAQLLIWSMVPYRISKLCMSCFFILRLYFVFNTSALAIKKWIILMLLSLSICGALLGVFAAIAGPLRAIKVSHFVVGPYSAAALALTIVVDLLVMVLYSQRLMKVTIMSSSVKDEPIGSLRPATAGTRESRGQSELQTMEEGQSLTASQPSSNSKAKVPDKFIGVATQSTLLSLIGIVTSFWLHIEITVSISQGVGGIGDGVLFRAVACFDGAVNVICMFLVFPFAKPFYDIGCKCCHIGTRKVCKKITKSMVLKAHKDAETKEVEL